MPVILLSEINLDYNLTYNSHIKHTVSDFLLVFMTEIDECRVNALG